MCEKHQAKRLRLEAAGSASDPRMSAVIRFTKTVINPSVDAPLFSARAE
jgi:hypothetical protein